MRNFYLLRTFFLASIILISLSVTGQVTLMSVDDGTAFKQWPDSTAAEVHSGGNIFVYKTDTTEAIAYVKFDIKKFEGKIVSEAFFSTRSNMKSGTMTVKLTKSSSTDFARETLNWNNKPGTSGELATVVYDEDSNRKEFLPNETNLTDYINQALADGEQYIAFGLKYKEGDGVSDWIGGAGNGSWGPMLELTFNEGFNYSAIDDGTAFKEKPDSTVNMVHSSNVFIWKTDTTEAIAYVKFELPGFAYKSVSSAEFSTRAAMKSGKTMTVALTGAKSANFTRDELTWNNKPGTTGKLATVLLNDDSKRKIYTENGNKLIEFINNELAEGNETIAFALKYEDGDGAKADFSWAGGAGDGAYGPMLKVTEGMAGGGYATDDGFVLQAFPDSMASPNASNIYASKSSDTTERIAYVKFDITAFTGKTVEDVKFSLRGAMESGTMTLGLHKLNTTSFSGDSITWNTRPGSGNEVATLVLDTNSERKYFIPTDNKLVDYVNQNLISGNEEIGFALKYKDGEGDLSWIGGKDDGAYGPMLELEFGYGFNSYAIDDGVGFKEDPDSTLDESVTNIFIWKEDSKEAISYVKFDVSALAGETITEAVFSTRAAMAEEGKTMTVALVEAKSTDFTRDSLNWNNKPGTGDELATVVIEKSSARKEYTPTGTSLVDYVNEKLAAMDSEIAFAIKYKAGDGAESDFSWCGGAGDGSYGPMLELEIEKPTSIDTITVIEDTYALEAYPDSTGEGVADMQIGRDETNSANKESFLKFPVEEKTSPVGKVTLLLKGAIKDSNPDDLEAFSIEVVGVSNAWLEDTLDWDNKPAEDSDVLATYDITRSAVHEVSGDALAHYVNDALKAGATEVSFVVKGKDDTGENRAWISSKEWVAAQMVLDYTVAPPAQEGNVIEDAYVSQVDGEQDANYGGEADQHLINDDANDNSKWIYFKYDLSNAYDNPVSATLKLYGSIHTSATEISEFDYQVFAASNNNWSEDTITWSNKPEVESNVLLEGTLVAGGQWYELNSPAFSEYIADAVENGKDQITLVAKGTDKTTGNRAWISGKEWNGSSLIINYEPQVEAPVFSPAAGEYIAEVEVEIITATPNATIYYTTDGTEPTDASMEYTGKIMLTDSATVKAIGYADELKPSIITSAEYLVPPVGIPSFFPSPLVTYTDDNPPVVMISVEPTDAIIYYSDDGSDPATPYPATGLPITETTTLRVMAVIQDSEDPTVYHSSEIVEVTYVVEATVEGIGIGPGGVGYSDNSISGQPENTLWLKADEIEGLTDGDLVTSWMDMSGNENNATDIFAGIRPKDSNDDPIYHKTIAEPPVFVADGTNGLPTVNFGPVEGRENNLGALSLPDVMNGEEDFDGMGGLSVWVVLKRNELNDWQAIVEKRDFTGQDNAHKNAWILEFNGSGGETGDENKPMLSLNKEHYFTGSEKVTSTEESYIIGADHRAFERSTIWLNGRLDGFRAYDEAINDVEAPLVIGNAVKANISEVIFFKNGLNEPQKVIVQNYLAAKYGLDLYENHIYAHDTYVKGVIGVGKAMYADLPETHLASSGGGLELKATNASLEADEYLFAGHNGADNSDENDSKTWARRWYVETSQDASVNASMGFNFADAGLTTPASADGYALWYSADGESFTALDAAAVLSGDVISFDLTAVAEGYYVLSVGEVTGTEPLAEMDDLVNLYPNPTTGNANLVINNTVDGDFTINIHNMTGSLVKQVKSAKAAGPHTEVFDVSQFKPGIYIIEVVQGNKRALKRLIKK